MLGVRAETGISGEKSTTAIYLALVFFIGEVVSTYRTFPQAAP